MTKFQAGRWLAGEYKGLRFDRLKILDKIGAGGMGTVFLCEHLGLRKQVAVKVLPPDQAGDEGVREHFFREACAAAALDHPNIVRVHDMSSTNGVHYIVMEFVDGQDLQSIVNKYGPLSYGRACGYIAQAALGLQHAHEKGIVHRDIKPANLLVDKDGVVKVLDMGLAQIKEEGNHLTEKFDKSGRARHRRLHGARTDHGVEQRRYSRRHLFARRDPVHDHQRQAAVLRQLHAEADEAHVGEGDVADADSPRSAEGPVGRRRSHDGEEPGRPLPDAIGSC